MSEVELARRKLKEMKMGKNVFMYIQAFCTQMYKVPEMTQEEAFSLFMRGLEPRIREQIGYHVKGDLGRAMAMAEKPYVWQSCSEEQNQKGQNKQKTRRVKTVRTWTKSKRKQKAVVGEEGFWERSPGKRNCDYKWSI